MELDSKIDGAAAAANADFLAEASLYPTAPIANLEERLRSIFGADATYGPFEDGAAGGALLVTKDGVTREELARYGRALVVLRTRARFVAITPLDPRGNLLHLELVVYAKNPHGPRDLSPALFFTWGHSSLRDLERVLVGPNVVCPCGARHVVFRSKRALQSDPETTVSFPCQKCGRSTLVVPAWKGGSGEAHLKERLPEERIAWLPEKASDANGDPHAVTQDDFPEHFDAEARRAFKGGVTSGGGSSFRWVAVTIPIVMMIVRLASTSARSSYTPPPVTPLSLAPLSHGDPSPTCAHDRECFAATLTAFGTEATNARRPQLAAAAKEAVAKLGDDGSCDAAQVPIETVRNAEVDPKTDPTLLLKQVDVLVASLQYCERRVIPATNDSADPVLTPP
jgi:hypothetical protein